MTTIDLLYPMLAMIGLTLVVGIVMFVTRIQAVKSGAVSVKYFALVEGQEVPARMKQAGNNFNNLLAVPVLFYVLSFIIILTQQVDSLYVWLGWLFVAARVVHSAIHITYNKVMHRMLAFLVALIMVFVMFLRLVFSL